jgi:YD repeat-containing protein
MTEFDPTSISLGYTYDANGCELTFRDSEGDWWECTYDENGNPLTYRSSTGFWSERTYGPAAQEPTFRNSKGVEI